MIKLLLFILLHDVVHATGQMLLKRGMGPAADTDFMSVRGIIGFLKFSATSITLWCGLALNTLCLLIWLIILSFADLSQAFPLDSLQYLIITFFAIVFLGEKVNRKRWIGIAVLIAGIILVGIK